MNPNATLYGERDAWGSIWNFKGNSYYLGNNANRHDSLLIECVKTLGEKANGDGSSLEIVTVGYEIDNDHGYEKICCWAS